MPSFKDSTRSIYSSHLKKGQLKPLRYKQEERMNLHCKLQCKHPVESKQFESNLVGRATVENLTVALGLLRNTPNHLPLVAFCAPNQWNITWFTQICSGGAGILREHQGFEEDTTNFRVHEIEELTIGEHRCGSQRSTPPPPHRIFTASTGYVVVGTTRRLHRPTQRPDIV